MLLDFLSQFQCLIDHDTYSIKNFMNGSIAHEGRGGDQLVFDINMSFFHILVHMFAAHLLHRTCCLSIWPPEEDNKCTVRTVFFFF